MNKARRYIVGGIAILASIVVFIVPFAYIILTSIKDARQAATRNFDLPIKWQFWENFVDVIQTRDYMLVTAFINSMILTVASVTLLVIFGAMVGFVLQRRPSRASRRTPGPETSRPSTTSRRWHSSSGCQSSVARLLTSH